MREGISNSWRRYAVILLTGIASFYFLTQSLPASLTRSLNWDIFSAEKTLFYTQTLSPISPGEALVIKRSGDVADPAQSLAALIPLLAEPRATITAQSGNASSDTNTAASTLKINWNLFAVPDSIVPMVEFWKRIFAVYGRSQVVMHHRDRLDLVFSVLDFTSFDDPELAISDTQKKTLRYQLIELERASVLAAIKRAPDASSQYADLIKDPELIRAQTGIREKFAEAIKISGRYLPHMEEIFRQANLPVELTRLPFIESSFDLNATSSVGAAGIWQFMESTGRLYLTVDSDIDDRRDPLRATVAAAQFFQKMVDVLHEWPLVINGYNTGHGRIVQAVKALGTTDIGQIIHNFKHPTYQFASRNFYPEFVAALSVYDKRAHYFAEITPNPPLQFDSVASGIPVSLPLLASYTKVGLDELKTLNPALSDVFFQGTKLLPPHIELKVPYLMSDHFNEAIADLSRMTKPQRLHVVAPGETIDAIATHYQVPVKDILDQNGLLPSNDIEQGWVLRIPERETLAAQGSLL